MAVTLTRFTTFILGLCSLLMCSAAAAENKEGCFQTTVVTVPSRPSFSNGASTTQCGVAEVEYGWNREWPGGGARQDSFGGGLRLGITPRLDFHWSSDSFLNAYDGQDAEHGFGDTWLGLKYRFYEGSQRAPALAILYLSKIPSANEDKGLGTGHADHIVSLLASRDIASVHLDFNVIEFLGGRDPGPGFDHCTQFALSASAPIKGRLGAILEGYGATELSSDTPSFASSMLAVTYQVNRRLVLDGGLDVGLTHGTPSKRVFLGFTYAIKNVYAWIAPRSGPVPQKGSRRIPTRAEDDYGY
jgi:hypothetical protein